MKIRTLQEANKSLSAARIDLQRCLWAQNLRDQLPKTYQLQERQDLLKFYMSQWPQFASEKNHRKLWSDQLDVVTENVREYIANVEKWREKKIGTIRNVMPKKKQRAMGLLPSVEQEIAMLEGRL